MTKPSSASTAEIVITGIGVSPGVMVGAAYVVPDDDNRITERTIDAADVVREIGRFEEAVIATRRQIGLIYRGVLQSAGRQNATIFEAHLMVLDDSAFVEEVIGRISSERRNCEVIVAEAAEKFATALLKASDTYLRERVADIRDVAQRIIRNLGGRAGSILEGLTTRSIIIARDLSPSETAGMQRDLVLGFVTEQGSFTSHTAIMARSLDIPAIVGMSDLSQLVTNGEPLLIDGNKGILIIRPASSRLREYGHLVETRQSIHAGLQRLRDLPAQTPDGRELTVAANVEILSELPGVARYGARGIGLYRTEYLYLSRPELPSEDEQVQVYTTVVRTMAPHRVIIRTFDMGGDKLPRATVTEERNPFLGFRAIRFCLANPEIFKAQLRAILRASSCGSVAIMYPMVSSLQEIQQANILLEDAKVELRARGEPFDEAIDIGIMVEIPAAALIAEHLAPHVKFFSLGTNDLVQYSIAVDRGNERVARLYQPTHPGVLRLIDMTVKAARRHGIWVGVCGEMAGDPLMTALLLGLGIDELSMVPSSIPMVKDMIRKTGYVQAQALSAAALTCSTAEEVVRLCRKLTGEVAPEILELIP